MMSPTLEEVRGRVSLQYGSVNPGLLTAQTVKAQGIMLHSLKSLCTSFKKMVEVFFSLNAADLQSWKNTTTANPLYTSQLV